MNDGKFLNLGNGRIAIVLSVIAGYALAYSQLQLNGWSRFALSTVAFATEIAAIVVLERKKSIVSGN